jgi:hypothetical protein
MVTLITRVKHLWCWVQPRFATTVVSQVIINIIVLNVRMTWQGVGATVGMVGMVEEMVGGHLNV